MLLSPAASQTLHGRACASALAGDAGEVVDLARAGVRNLRRRQSQAEVHALRKALLGHGPARDPQPRDLQDEVVGLVCEGRLPDATPVEVSGSTVAAPAPRTEVIAVTDHANLTWDSPLTGPNDDSLGPRFPVTAGLYEPAPVAALPGAREGVVAGVCDELDLTPFERRVVAPRFLGEGMEFAAVSAELAPVVILAAHLGFRVAAAVIAAAGPAAADQQKEQHNEDTDARLAAPERKDDA